MLLKSEKMRGIWICLHWWVKRKRLVFITSGECMEEITKLERKPIVSGLQRQFDQDYGSTYPNFYNKLF